MTRLLSASRLNDFLGCPHQSALWFADISPPQESDETLELLRNKGFAHEADVLANLEQSCGSATRIESDRPLQERVEETLAAIRSGAPLIYQASLTGDSWLGFPDFLLRKTSANGTSVWEPEDAKLARKAKAEYLLQLGVYAELLEALFGFPVDTGAIHVSGGPPQRFDLRQTRYILKRLMRNFESFAAQSRHSTRAIPCGACAQCDFKPRCEDEWRKSDSPFFVAGVSSAQVAKLEAAGLRTMAQLATWQPGTKIDGVGAETLAKVAAQARLQLRAREAGNHCFEILPLTRGRGFSLLPPPDDGDLFFDMEGDPLTPQGLEYLFGLYGRVDGGAEPRFQPSWAHTSADEKTAFEAIIRFFVEHLARHPDAHIYHYAAYEPSALKRLAMRYATMEAELDQMLRDRRFVDLYRVAVQSIRASTESYSLKDLEPLFWADRKGDIRTAAASIVEYERWCVTRDDTILKSIALYNENDCISTAHLRRWLESLRPSGVRYEIIDDLRPEKRERSEERAQLEAHKQSVAARVRSSGQADPRVRDVVAELIWFHQRAQKPGWWAVFERQ